MSGLEAEGVGGRLATAAPVVLHAEGHRRREEPLVHQQRHQIPHPLQATAAPQGEGWWGEPVDNRDFY